MKTNSQGESRLTYIDATIPSYLVSRPSRAPETAERQKITREFWQDTRFEFILSDYVIGEISIGNRDQATDRLRAVECLSILVVRNADRVLAQRLVDQGALPQIAFTDAVHISRFSKTCYSLSGNVELRAPRKSAYETQNWTSLS